jgi:hypothetical protein
LDGYTSLLYYLHASLVFHSSSNNNNYYYYYPNIYSPTIVFFSTARPGPLGFLFEYPSILWLLPLRRVRRAFESLMDGFMGID